MILGIEVRPNTTLAADAGLQVEEKGAIWVDERMQAAVEGVWAAGDCMQSFHLVSKRPFYVALGTVANKQGRDVHVMLSHPFHAMVDSNR